MYDNQNYDHTGSFSGAGSVNNEGAGAGSTKYFNDLERSSANPTQSTQNDIVNVAQTVQEPAVIMPQSVQSSSVDASESAQSIVVEPQLAQSAAVELVQPAQSTGVELVQPMQGTVVESVQPMQGAAVNPAQPMQGAAVNPAQPAQSAIVEPVQPAQSAVVNPTQPAQSVAVNPTQPMQGAAVNPVQPPRNAAGATWVKAPVRSDSADRQKPPREERKLGLGQKIMLSISLGLFFGIFAGVGFYGVTQATGAMQAAGSLQDKMSNHVEENYVPSNTDGVVSMPDISEKEPESSQIQQAGSGIVYSTASTNVSAIVKEVMPAMVSIINNYTEVTSFWGQTYREDVSASGSGIIVSANDEELLIVTNQHVVADARQLLVTLIDNTEVEAKIKGVDTDMDLAVIAINTNDLKEETLEAISIANLGDSDKLELGEQVIAIGNALGYGQSVTVGYVSALDREIELEDGSFRSFIQTDAAINPGNSGGALLNAAGEVIGINSNKIGGSSIEGMGYAIPITAASPIIADLMERQTRSKVASSDLGYMGITPQDVTDQIVRMYGMPKGVYVVAVYEGSAAETAGINKGDVITKFDGLKISCYDDLQEAMQYYAVGDSVKVTVMRPSNGEYVEYEFTLTLGRRPSETRY